MCNRTRDNNVNQTRSRKYRNPFSDSSTIANLAGLHQTYPLPQLPYEKLEPLKCCCIFCLLLNVSLILKLAQFKTTLSRCFLLFMIHSLHKLLVTCSSCLCCVVSFYSVVENCNTEASLFNTWIFV